MQTNLALTFVQYNLKTAKRQRDEDEADPVYFDAASEALPTFRSSTSGSCTIHCTSTSESRPIGPIDQKIQCQDRLSVSQPPKHRANHWRNDDRNAVKGEGLPTQPGGERICKHRLLGRRHPTTTQSLQDAKDNEGREGRRQCAKKGALL